MRYLLFFMLIINLLFSDNKIKDPNEIFVKMIYSIDKNKTMMGHYLMDMAYKKHNPRALYLMGVFFDEISETKNDNNYTVAINFYLDAYNYYKKRNDKKEMLKCMRNIGIDFFKMQNYNKAKKYLQIASNLGNDDSTYLLSKIYLWEFGFKYKDKNRRLLIKNKLKTFYEMLLKSKKYHGIALVRLGAWYSDNNDYKKALKLLLEAANKYKINDANLILSSVYKKLNNIKMANYYKAEYFSNLNLTIEKLDNIKIKLPPGK